MTVTSPGSRTSRSGSAGWIPLFFVNRQKNKIKGILRDGNGFWLVYKRLSRSSLQWPVSTDQSDFMRIDCSQLASLLSGLSIVPQPAFLPRTYKYV
ncbi:transposase [Allobaculum sp. Allo2]|uniref:transposase n=1 Tax=Allobaculum sp. Allo2 TaxID=2853432 RepID=UPI001F614CEC|nr:transposase [Allobaculum sp. Allo2]UNT93868.1 transposase [Allobaculum sp. Allo2]UNT93922.1 transposase [Allobaculum sp. Allo2]